MVQCVAHAFLKCWALITIALISCFQYDDHPTLLDAMAHVKINISFFQVALRDTCVMLPKVI
jgi:hypothetical protein